MLVFVFLRAQVLAHALHAVTGHSRLLSRLPSLQHHLSMRHHLVPNGGHQSPERPVRRNSFSTNEFSPSTETWPKPSGTNAMLETAPVMKIQTELTSAVWMSIVKMDGSRRPWNPSCPQWVPSPSPPILLPKCRPLFPFLVSVEPRRFQSSRIEIASPGTRSAMWISCATMLSGWSSESV